MMRKKIERIRNYKDQQDEALRHWLDSLSPQTKLSIVIGVFTVFAGCALFMFGTAIYHLGQYPDRGIEIHHIRHLELHQRQDSINLLKQYYDGTEQESNPVDTCTETGKETETVDGRAAS
ncbi:TraL conjugative transposon family protein [Bacteroides graminisolvens]|uniref:TraL conjugative transposon family protein n=1 Tax=Bacteroides graminisolvens TaxID=477666 RepID=UPI002409F3C6|nr:TraL conjugative transposon family protein [Bacteroides graminisolvens]